MKNKFLVGFLVFSSFVFSQTNIADARNNFNIGQTVTVKGVVTNGSELGPIRYMQDASGAIAAYGNSLSGTGRGDSITVTGVLLDFNGLLEISPVNNFTNHSNVGTPSPMIIPITLAAENLESRLIKLVNVMFEQTGTFAGNTNYSVTDGTNTLQVRVANGTSLVGQAIPTGAVNVTGLLGQFQTNYQILPRDLNDVEAYVPPAQEINCLVNTLLTLNNGTAAIGNATSSILTIQNEGTGTLDVTNITFSGADAGDFSISATTGSISGGGSQDFTITYTPNGNGSRTAQLNISSNDSDENPYIINIDAVGVDGLADEPSAAASNMSFSNVSAYSMNMTFTGVASATKYLVLWKNGSAASDLPVDGTTYKRGDYIGGSKVLASGVSTAFVPRGVIANQDYHFAVYPYNGSEGTENYLTTGALTGNQSSLGANIGNYYNGISSSQNTLVSDLTAKINPHTVITYVAYKSSVMQAYEVKDTTDGQSYVTCAYSGENKIFDDPFDWTATGYSREHTYAHSWMPVYDPQNPNTSESLPEYSDQHNLYPANLNQANTPRSNLPLGEVVSDIVFTYLEGSVGKNADGQLAFEPRAKHKGNAARALFYMATAYHNINGFNWSIPSGQDVQVLRDWHFADLPDNYEIGRHELIFFNQGNRNPYIDSTDFVCFVDFTNMSYNPDACALSTSKIYLDENQVVIFPNPAKEQIYIQVNGLAINAFEIKDLQGRTVVSKKVNKSMLENLDVSNFTNGNYLIEIHTDLGRVTKKFSIQ